MIEQQSVGAELGADSVKAGALACVMAVALIAVFMFLAYGFIGPVASVSATKNVCS